MSATGLLNGMGGPSISADGRFVAFDSEATNLVRGDTNETADVFVHDRLIGSTTRVSVASDGAQANAGGTEADISADGRFVAFVSFSDNLVPDGNFTGTSTFTIARPASPSGSARPPTGPTPTASRCSLLLLSDDGRFVYFTSFASNLVAGDPENNAVDAYLFDRQTATMTAITSNRGSSLCCSTLHGLAGGISGDGRYLTFTTQDSTLVTPDTNGFFEDAWLVDRVTGQYLLVGVNPAGAQGDDSTFAGDVSAGGRFVTVVSRATSFGGPSNFKENVYLRDRVAGTTRLVSVASDGTEGDLDSLQPAVTPMGKWLPSPRDH